MLFSESPSVRDFFFVFVVGILPILRKDYLLRLHVFRMYTTLYTISFVIITLSRFKIDIIVYLLLLYKYRSIIGIHQGPTKETHRVRYSRVRGSYAITYTRYPSAAELNRV